MMEAAQEARTLGRDDGDGQSSAELVKKETSLRLRYRTALNLGNVSGLGGSEILQEIVEVLGDVTILSSDKTKKVAVAFQTLLKRTRVVWKSTAVLGVNLLCLVKILLGKTFGPLVNSFPA